MVELGDMKWVINGWCHFYVLLIRNSYGGSGSSYPYAQLTLLSRTHCSPSFAI